MRDRIEYKSDADIVKMRRAGLVVADIHAALREAAVAGKTTADMDRVALDVLQRHGAKSNFYGYYGYPGQICASVNEVIVHGIPGERVLQPGDIVSFDCGAVVDGWHGDACTTVVIPGGDEEVRARRERLSEITEQAMWTGIAAFARGKRIGDIGDAIDDFVEAVPEEDRPDIVLNFTGHGIGSTMHQPPEVLNFSVAERTARIKRGMVICIEPILAAGNQANTTLDDEWTAVTDDGSDACHWEHMVAMHSKGIWVLTAPDGGVAGLAPYGITPVPLGE
ncbi:MAG: type I methionyl aminopeptidase [Actinomycetaceae bacterium]|nr:type I methionyl aminopeptidase [Actinomycetaceae bacterium]